MQTLKSEPLYTSGATHLKPPNILRATADFFRFIICNAVVDALDAWRAFQRSDIAMGACFGAIATVYLFILSGATW